MTLLLFAAGAAFAALGTRSAALAFVGAAVTATQGSDLVAVGTWTAALAAGWLLLTRTDIRRVAIPALGAAAVLAVGSAPNGAVVCGLWVIATAAAVISRGPPPAGDRWAAVLLISDVLVVVAVATTIPIAFEGWPSTLGPGGTTALLACAAIRIPLASGATDGEPLAGLLIVRTQCAVLVSFVLAAGGPSVRQTAAVAAAAAFAVGPVMLRRATADTVQELSLFSLALAVAGLGWGPRGWAWGALAAGTLMHYLRFTVGRRTASAYAQALGRTAAIGLPFVPVVLALLEGCVRSRGIVPTLVAVGLLGGLAARARAVVARTGPGTSRRSATSVIDDVRTWAVVAATGATALWAPLLTLPEAAGGARVGWPPIWAVLLVLAGGAAAGPLAWLGGQAAFVGRPRLQPLQVRAPDSVLAAAVRLDVLIRPRLLWAALGVLVTAATALWLVGVARGFL